MILGFWIFGGKGKKERERERLRLSFFSSLFFRTLFFPLRRLAFSYRFHDLAAERIRPHGDHFHIKQLLTFPSGARGRRARGTRRRGGPGRRRGGPVFEGGVEENAEREEKSQGSDWRSLESFPPPPRIGHSDTSNSTPSLARR